MVSHYWWGVGSDQPADDDRIGIYARGQLLRTDDFLWRESQRGHDVNGESKLLVDHVALNVIVLITV